MDPLGCLWHGLVNPSRGCMNKFVFGDLGIFDLQVDGDTGGLLASPELDLWSVFVLLEHF